MDLQPAQRIYTRERNWDYRQPAIYLITLTVKDRQPLLGMLVGGVDDARVEPTNLGWKVFDLIGDIPNHHPEIQILQRMIMPDHVHFILRVNQPMQQPLGTCIRGLKWACNEAWKQSKSTLFPQPERLSGEETSLNDETSQSLFEQDFYPSRLVGNGQLRAMFDYLRDNPRRLAVKRARSEYFRIERGVMLEGTKVDMIGNQSLLDGPLQVVHVHQVWTPTEIEQHARLCVASAQSGAALISPFISRDERRIRDSVLQQGGKVVVIRQEGFGELYKPEPLYFDACAEGRVLLVAVGEYHQKGEQVSRTQCVEMNSLAERVAFRHPVSSAGKTFLR